jgi:hypothetical protein
MARHFWPNENPIGKRLKQGWPEWTTPWREVIGVVADVKLNGVIDTTPLHVYLPLSQEGMASVYLAVRTRQEPQALAASVQSTLHALDSQVPIYQVRTMDERLKAAVVSQRAAMVLLSAFAVVAMLLAAVGIYGVISWGALQRTREMGLRMALGALPREVMWLVLRRSMLLVSGRRDIRFIGCVCSKSRTRCFSDRNRSRQDAVAYGVQAVDPITFIIAPIFVGTRCVHCLLFAGLAGHEDRSVSGTQVRVRRCRQPAQTDNVALEISHCGRHSAITMTALTQMQIPQHPCG